MTRHIKHSSAGAIFTALAFFVILPAKVWVAQSFSINVESRRMITEQKPAWLLSPIEPTITIAAVGDLMMSSWIIDVVKENGVDFPLTVRVRL
jgi:hypothetical protein